jgi:hypothetical protein
MIIGETPKDLDESGNPVINPQYLGRGAKYIVERETKAIIAARVTV